MIRYDVTGRIRKVVRTPQGGIKVEAVLTRTGVFDYLNPDGSVRREMRPASEVFKADSLATLAHAPVTDDHPSDMVSPETWDRSNVVGHVASDARREDDLVVAELVIQSAEAIKKIEKEGKRELSCGYRCDVTGQAGENFDAVQTGIKYNHVALVKKGRAGERVALRIDGEGNQLQSDQRAMKIEIINGVEYEVGTQPHAKAVAERDASQARNDQRLEELEAENAQLKEDLAAKDEDFQKRMDERIETMSLAKRFDVDPEGKSNDEVRLAVLLKLVPSLEGSDKLKSQAYVDARLDAAVEQAPEGDPAGKAQAKILNGGENGGKRADAAPEIDPSVTARETMKARLRSFPTPDRTTVLARSK